MLKDTIKTILAVATVATTMVACGGSDENPDAVALYDSAKTSFEANNPQQAISIIDSLQSLYPKEISLQRKAMYLRTLADSVMLDIETVKLDSTIIADSIAYINLKPKFDFVKEPDMVEGYYRLKSLKGSPLYERTGIEPRVDESGNMVITTCLFGVPAKHTAISVSCSAGEASTEAVPYDEALNYRYQAEGGSCEMVTFNYDKCTDFCKFIADNRDQTFKLTFKGNRNHTISLSKQIVNAIADTYDYSMAITSGKNATAQKLFVAKKRELNRQQIEKTKNALKE